MYLLAYDIFRSASNGPQQMEEKCADYDDLFLKIQNISYFSSNVKFENKTLKYSLIPENDLDIFELVYRLRPKFGEYFYRSKYYHIGPFVPSVKIVPKVAIRTFQQHLHQYIHRNRIQLSQNILQLLHETFQKHDEFVDEIIFSSYVSETLQHSKSFQEDVKDEVLDEFYEMMEKNNLSDAFQDFMLENQKDLDFNDEIDRCYDTISTEKKAYEEEFNRLEIIKRETEACFRDVMSTLKRGERVEDEKLLKDAKNEFNISYIISKH